MKWKTKHEEYLETELGRIREEHKAAIASLRAEHGAELAGIRQDHSEAITGYKDVIATLKEQITRLQDDLDRTRLFLHPGLKPDSDSGKPPDAVPEEEQGTPWQRLARRAVKAQQDEDAQAKVVQQTVKRRRAKAPQSQPNREAQTEVAATEGAS